VTFQCLYEPRTLSVTFWNIVNYNLQKLLFYNFVNENVILVLQSESISM